ncbi:hypothetical protein BaRGS_00012470, partial [Batillaria attramentaria]
GSGAWGDLGCKSETSPGDPSGIFSQRGLSELVRDKPNCARPQGSTVFKGLDTEDKEEFYQLDSVALAFKRYYLWAIVALGLPGNVASLLTFLHMRSLGSCVVYVGVLAVVDSLALLEKLFLSLMQEHGEVFTPGACKALIFLANAIMMYANWIVVALATERLFAVCRPLAVSVYWTRGRALCGLGILLVVMLVVCVPAIVATVPTDGGFGCGMRPDLPDLVLAWHWANVSLYGFLPCVLLLVINISIITRLRQARNKQQQLCHGHGPVSRRGKHQTESQRQANVILLVAAFVLIILTTPRCALVLMRHFWHPEDPVLKARLRVIRQVTFALSDLNHAINFFLYFVSAKHFRSRFLDLFRSTKSRLRRLSSRETVHHKISDSESCRYMMASRPDSIRSGRNVGGWDDSKNVRTGVV